MMMITNKQVNKAMMRKVIKVQKTKINKLLQTLLPRDLKEISKIIKKFQSKEQFP